MHRFANPFCLLLAMIVMAGSTGLCCCIVDKVQVQVSSCCDDESSPATPVQNDCKCRVANNPIDQPNDHQMVVEDSSFTRVMPVTGIAALPSSMMPQSFWRHSLAANPALPEGLCADTLLTRHCLLTT
jgi:hypothetical protein